MTDKSLFSALFDILNTINPDDYPEIHSIICYNIDENDKTVYSDPFGIVQELFDADASKQLPKCVSDFFIDVLEDELSKGNADAACDIGSLYYTGRAGEQSYEKALEYYTVAAEGGCRQAQENLGYCYYYGRATKVDYEKAFHWFALGAFDGHINSLYKIGDMYRNGYYVDRNSREAFNIYMRCLDTLSDEAVPTVGADVLMRVADCYFEGIGTRIDFKIALKYYQEAEQLFYNRLQNGDFLIKGCYEKVIARQNEARSKLQESLPDYEWTK